MTTQAQPSQQTGGFTLVEVMVSMTLLSVASLALGSMLFRASRAAGATSNAAYQTAAISGEAARLGALPFDLLAVGTTCETVTTPPFPHTSCATINSVSSKVKQVTVVVTPSGNSLLQPVTTSFNRTISGNGKPLKTP
jgi:prepilin-type N-terminal cleavage/methylation domain-containing protein